ncbi:anti-sigma factor family protein [Mycolicibacterium sp. XJ870]
MNDDEPHVLLGAYVLGGLNADERRQFEEHLGDCPQCRRDLSDCAALPALLTNVDPADLDVELKDGVGDRSARRSSRWWTAGAALAGAAAAVAIGVATVTIPGEDPPAGVGTYAVNAITGDVGGMVTLTPMPWGTAISLDLKKLPAEGVFTLRTMDDRGRMEPAANWAGMPSGSGVVHGSTSIPMPQLRKLNVVDANNTVLATTER